MDSRSVAIRRAATSALQPAEIARIRELLWAAFGDDPDEAMTESDWEHALGGTHVVLEVDGRIAAQASVVEREIHVGDRSLRTGYVEALGVDPAMQGRGHGSAVMHEVNALIRERFELGALGTGAHHFYERLGWVTWPGPTFVRTANGPLPTPDEDGYILVLTTPSTPELDPAAPISCAWRGGDAW